MIRKSLLIFCLVSPLILLAACNFPTGETAPTASPTLSLEEIQALAAGTLAVEATRTEAAATPLRTDVAGESAESVVSTETPTPSQTPAPSPTPTATATSPPARCTVLANALNTRYGPGIVYAPPIATLNQGTELEPLARNGDASWIEAKVVGQSTVGWTSANPQLIACDIDVASLPLGIIPPTPTPSNTPTPLPVTATNTPTPSSTPCPKLTNATLSATVIIGAGNQVSLAWGSAGGCGPITGTLTAQYKGDPSPYASYSVKGQTGKLTDKPPVKCEGTFTIVYTLTLKDSSGQTVTVTATAKVTWIC